MRTGALGRVQRQLTSSWAAFVTPAGSGRLLLGWTVVYCAPGLVKGWFRLSGSDLRTKRSPHQNWLARYGLLRNRGGGGAGRRGWGCWRMIRFFMRIEMYWQNERLLRENATQHTSCLQGWLQVSYAVTFTAQQRFDGGPNNKRASKKRSRKWQTTEFHLFNTKTQDRSGASVVWWSVHLPTYTST